MRRCCLPIVLLVLPGRLLSQQWKPEREGLDILLFQGRRALELTHLQYGDPWLADQPIYQGLWLRETGAVDSVVFDLLPFASAPRSRDGIVMAFDEGTGSRMWTGFTDPTPVRNALLGTAAQALVNLWGAVSPMVASTQDVLKARPCPGMRLRLGKEAIQGFGTDGRDTPFDTRAVILYADCQRDLGGSWQVAAGLRGYHWRTPGMPDRQDVETALRVAHVPPSNGARLFVDASWTPQYQRAIVHLERPLTVHRAQLRPLLRIAWGDGLPFGLGFWPGGFDGFPGFKNGEGRGDREIMAAMDVIQPLVGKLSFRALFAVGRTANGGPIIPGSPWLVGARAGLNLDSRFGLLRLEYGLATQDHRALFIRLGRIL